MSYIDLHTSILKYADKHNRESQVYRVIFALGMEVFFKKTTNVLINTIELAKKLNVKQGYLRVIIHRLVDAGIIDYSEGSNNGDRVLFFNLEGVTRQIQNIFLNFKSILNKKKSAHYRPKNVPLRGTLRPKFARKRIRYNLPDKNKCLVIDKHGEIKEFNRSFVNDTKKTLISRMFQSENFRTSYKQLVRA